MKDDLISKTAAIDAVEEIPWYHQNKNGEMVQGANSSEHQAWYKADDIYHALYTLPPAQPVEDIHREKEQAYYCGYEDGAKAARSAQPGQRNARVFQGIIVEYPSISAYPEYEGKPYFSIKYTENGQEFIGYGTYKPEVLSEYLKEYFMPPTQPGWIPTSERLPDNDRAVLVTLKWAEDDYEVAVGEYWHNSTASHGWGSFEGHVIAWHELPTPYREGGQDGEA